MPPTKTVWKLEDHTLGKHKVLRAYLDAWFPIMGSRNGRILFIDGYAGPGEYEGGEDGSPIIAIKSLIEHTAKKQISAEIVFLFIEKDAERAKHLEEQIAKLQSQIPANCKIEVVNHAFDDTLTAVLDQADAKAKFLAPPFVMVDPFGVSGTPMSVVERILRNPKSEVYISFMYESINRFKGTKEFEPHLDALFGTSDWKDGIDIEDDSARKQFFYNLYEQQLRKAGASCVLKFELFEGNKLVYAIFFGTGNLIGCDKMKQAIWKVAPFGDFAFRSSRANQLILDVNMVDFSPLKDAIAREFSGKGWVKIEQVNEFVASDKTDFHTGQFKKNVLVPMENNGEIEVREDTRNRKRTFPAGTVLKFK